MSEAVSRRDVLAGAAGAAGLSALGLPVTTRAAPLPAVSAWPAFPHQDPALVREVVGASHGRFDRVRELVGAHPALANAAWDWGFGDWETSLGAAAHTGRREIAEYLLSMGARPDLFAAAMLGHLDTVRSVIASIPGVATFHGPHGITLLAHARAGGEPAKPVLEFLSAVPGADEPPPAITLDAPTAGLYTGVYSYGPMESDRFSIAYKKDNLWFEKEGEASRGLLYRGANEFHPAGAPGVRFRFTVEAEATAAASISDHDLVIRARRLE